jgi:1,4-dihydroxy-2-naphthoate octaprenyltransferase
VALGAVEVILREPLAIWIGAMGVVLGWSYHGPPLRFAYRGLGELDVVVCYGPLVVLSVYLIQTGTLSWPAFWLSLPLGRKRASRVLPVIYAVGAGTGFLLGTH